MKKRPPSSAALRRLQSDNRRLTQAFTDLQKQLADERLKNAVPALTITAEPDHVLIVACAGLGMRVRTRSVTVSTGKI